MSGSEREESKNFELLHAVAKRLVSHLEDVFARRVPTVRLEGPNGLYEVFEKHGVPLPLDLDEQKPLDNEKLLESLECLIKYSVQTSHYGFLNQLYSKVDPISLAGEWISTCLNTNCHTFEVAPVFTLIEKEILAKVASIIGPNYNEHEGLFVPGGSVSNLYAMLLARHRIDPESSKRGMCGGPILVAFASDQAHYSYLKNSVTMGIGTSNMIKVKSSASGAMDPVDLERAILKAKEEGKVPFFVGATAGSTVLGAFDPYVKISDVCTKHGLWFHIDGCWGGSLLFSEKTRSVLKGAELSNSFAWNPHKMVGTALQSSVFITRHKGVLEALNAQRAKYLFQKDKNYTEYDTGDMTIQCGRKTDMFKLWYQWKGLGDAGIAKRVEHSVELANHLASKIKASNGSFVLALPPSCTNVVFFFVPKSMRPFDANNFTKEQFEAIDKVAPKIKSEMQHRGEALIGFQQVKHFPNCFRAVFANSSHVSKDDVDGFLETIELIGNGQN